VDDLESFFWVALWSVVFNEDCEHMLTRSERVLRKKLVEVKQDNAAGILPFIISDASAIMDRFLPVLMAWWEKAKNKGAGWYVEVLRCAPVGAGEEYYLPHFHRYALQGVVDILETISGYWNDEIGWDSWTKPTQSRLSLKLASEDLLYSSEVGLPSLGLPAHEAGVRWETQWSTNIGAIVSTKVCEGEGVVGVDSCTASRWEPGWARVNGGGNG